MSVSVSIAMASYNGERFISEQIDSILAQTCSDFELIIWDDCSTDNTWSILQKYAEKDSRIKIFRGKQNIGYVKNFERAIKSCQGEYIALSDQDDIWSSDHIEVLLKNIGSCYICCGSHDYIDEYGQFIGSPQLWNELKSIFVNNELRLEKMLYTENLYQGASMMLHKSFVQKLFPISTNTVHDAWFMFMGTCLRSFSQTDIVITHWRQHSKNATENKTKRKDFWKKVANVFKGKAVTNRYAICLELLDRLPDMSGEISVIVLKAKTFYEKSVCFFYRLFHIGFFLKHSKIIIPHTRAFAFFRVIKYVFLYKKP